MNSDWNIDSWRNFPVKHQPTYGDTNVLKNTEERLKSLPPLVFAGEARTLKEKLASVSEGKLFYCKEEIVRSHLRSLMLITSGTLLD